MKWISVKDQLPPENLVVMAKSKTKLHTVRYGTCSFCNKTGWYYDCRPNYKNEINHRKPREKIIEWKEFEIPQKSLTEKLMDKYEPVLKKLADT